MAGCGNPSKPTDDGASASKKSTIADSLIGDWITAEGEGGDEVSDTMGVKLMTGGRAQSINMPTYQYKSWKVKGDTIVLNASSTAPGMPADTAVIDTGIVDLKANTITLYGGDVVYKKK